VIQSERCFGAGHAARHWQAWQDLAWHVEGSEQAGHGPGYGAVPASHHGQAAMGKQA